MTQPQVTFFGFLLVRDAEWAPYNTITFITTLLRRPKAQIIFTEAQRKPEHFETRSNDMRTSTCGCSIPTAVCYMYTLHASFRIQPRVCELNLSPFIHT